MNLQWINAIEIKHADVDYNKTLINYLCNRHKQLWENSLGTCTSFNAKLHLKAGAQTMLDSSTLDGFHFHNMRR